MAIFSALLSLLSRKLGSLLQAVFGWAITGLFGRLPSSKQAALSAALLLSIAWPLLVLGVPFPGIASWAVAFVPLHDFAPRWILRLVWLALALVVPLIVGAIVRWVSPPQQKKGSKLQTVIAGYPLTLGFAIAFFITLFVVPALKLAAMAKRWSDEHVYCQVKKGAYQRVLHQVQQAAERGGVSTTIEKVPGVMAAPTKVIKWFARGGLDPIVADDPKMLKGQDLQLFLYPGDLLVRGPKKDVARVRAALLRELMHADAYLTQEQEAQRIEDELNRMWDVTDRHERGDVGLMGRQRVREIAHKLEKTALPVDQWSLLYLNLHRLERAACGGPALVDPEPKEDLEVKEVIMNVTDPKPEMSTVELVKEAIDETRQLVKLEVELAKDEVRQELADAKRSAIMFGVAAVGALLAAAMLLVALALAIFPGPVPALIIGAVLIAMAAVLGFIGYKKVPKKPLEKTRRRLETDAQVIKEGMA
jgi:uncharacterized membrane protein YqjE